MLIYLKVSNNWWNRSFSFHAFREKIKKFILRQYKMSIRVDPLADYAIKDNRGKD